MSKYNDCKECIDLSNSIKTYDEIFEILQSLNLPPEICYKIIELSVNYKYCSFCEIKLCDYHAAYATYYLTHYRGYDHGYMCNKCCLKE
jgi:hypothetical protein